jgi:hypothetical protein
MSLGTILLIVLILLLVGALPTWPHSSKWGYYPSGGLGYSVARQLSLSEAAVKERGHHCPRAGCMQWRELSQRKVIG